MPEALEAHQNDAIHIADAKTDSIQIKPSATDESSYKNDGNQSSHRASNAHRLTEIRMPLQIHPRNKFFSNPFRRIRADALLLSDAREGVSDAALDKVLISPRNKGSWFRRPVSSNSISLAESLKMRIISIGGLCGRWSNKTDNCYRRDDGLFQEQFDASAAARITSEADASVGIDLNADGLHSQVETEEGAEEHKIHAPIQAILREVFDTIPIAIPSQRQIDDKPSSYANSKDLSRGSKPAMMILNVNIRHIGISNHPLFVKEESYAVELLHLFDVFSDLRCKRNTEYCCNKAASIVDKISLMRNHQLSKEEMKSNEGQTKLVNDLYNDIVKCVSEMISTEHDLNEMYILVMKMWENVRKAREEQGFQCTTVTLTKHISPGSSTTNGGYDLEALASSINDMIPWIGNLLSFDAVPLDHCYEEEMKSLTWMISVVESSRHSQYDLSLAHGDDTVLSNIADFPKEQNRRDKVRSDKYMAQMFVNGAFIESSGRKCLDWPQWTIDFNEKFSCAVSSEPKEVCILLFRQRLSGVAPDELISSTFLAVPGMAAGTDFTSLHKLGPSIDSYLFQNRILKGKLEVMLEWEKPKEAAFKTINSLVVDEISFYPDFGSCSSNLWRTTSGFIEEAKESKNSSTDQISLNEYSMSFRMPGTRFAYTNFDRFQEPLRHYLIKQRHMHGTKVSIPLDERDISPDTIKTLIADRKSKCRSQDVSLVISSFSLLHCDSSLLI